MCGFCLRPKGFKNVNIASEYDICINQKYQKMEKSELKEKNGSLQ